jgi:CheY-like chemotaxis protein
MAVKILMADADLAVLELARVAMSSVQWCDLVTVTDGREATNCLQRQKFDGLITAARVPEVDGFELIQRVKESPLNAGIPIVMLTTDDDINTMRRGFKAGVTFFAVKPPNRERFYRLFSAVRGAMETERRRHCRLPYRTPVTCTLEDEARSQFVAESVEISEGGISLRPSGGVEIGKVLELEFLLPQLARPAEQETGKSRKSIFTEAEVSVTGPQKVRATVRYKAPSGESLGLSFLGLTPAQRQVIQQYITGGN